MGTETDAGTMGLSDCRRELAAIEQTLGGQPGPARIPSNQAAETANKLGSRHHKLTQRVAQLEEAAQALRDQPWTRERAVAHLRGLDEQREKYRTDQERLAAARAALEADPSIRLDLRERVPEPGLIPSTVRLQSTLREFLAALGSISDDPRMDRVEAEMARMSYFLPEPARALHAEEKARGLHRTDAEILHELQEPRDKWEPPAEGIRTSYHLDPGDPRRTELPHVSELNGPASFQRWLEAMSADKAAADLLAPALEQVLAEAVNKGWLRRLHGISGSGFAFAHSGRELSLARLGWTLET